MQPVIYARQALAPLRVPRHDAAVNLLPQEVAPPGGGAIPSPPTADLLHQLQSLGWVDHTALAVLLVFFVIGLFKGLIWQTSRVGILLAAYVVAGRFGDDLAQVLAPVASASDGAATTPPTTIYLAYVLLFLAVLIALSLLAILIQKLAKKAGLSFFDRLGGGLLGVATGACVVLFGLFVVNMFFPGTPLAQAAESSHSLRLSRQAIALLGERVPDDLRTVLALHPLRAQVPASAPAGMPAVAPPGSTPPNRAEGEPTEASAPRDVPPPPKRQNR